MMNDGAKDTFVERVKQGYNEGAAGYARTWHVVHPWMEEERARFGDLVKPGMLLLDAGCGPGRDSAFWSAKGLKTVGIDIAKAMLEIAREHSPKLEFHLLDLCDVSSLGLTFDCAWLAYILLHLPKNTLKSALESLHSVLRKDAPVFVSSAIGSETEERVGDIAGLVDSGGRSVMVPSVRWSMDEFRCCFRPYFDEEWSQLKTPLKGRDSYYFGIWRCV